MRTKRLVDAKLVPAFESHGKDRGESEAVARTLLEVAGLGFDGKTGLSQYLLFLGQREVDALVQLALDNWPVLASLSGGEGGKKAKRSEAPKELAERIRSGLDGGRAVSVAMFGRMLADAPGLNVDAAAQVAHALSTHQVDTEFDFYTAVDDLKPEETAGADMMGTVEFNSACFYRYMNVNLGQLRENLQGDEDLVLAALSAFLRAAVAAIPTGKQNSMAALNPPSVVLAVVGDGTPQNLANAFVKPISGRRGDGLVAESASAMLQARESLRTVYGSNGESGAWWCSTAEAAASPADGVTVVSNFTQLLDQAVAAAVGGK